MILSYLQFCLQDYVALLRDPATVGNTAQSQEYLPAVGDPATVGNTAQSQEYLPAVGDPATVGNTAQEWRAPVWQCHTGCFVFSTRSRASSCRSEKTKPHFCFCKSGALL
jgi:hypothetical protein